MANSSFSCLAMATGSFCFPVPSLIIPERLCSALSIAVAESPLKPLTSWSVRCASSTESDRLSRGKTRKAWRKAFRMVLVP